MKKIILLLLIYTPLFSQKKNSDYFEYHRQINKAEELYFLENKVDNALKIYDEVFQNYDFVFLKDLLIAAQIAKFNGKPFEDYILRSFEFGFKIDDLKKIHHFQDLHKSFSTDKVKINIFKNARQKYLDSIDYEYLDYIYNLAVQDQIDKYKKDYYNRLNNSFTRFINKVEQKGFPGEKLMGLTDTLIFKERGLPFKDINSRSRKNKITKHFLFTNRFDFVVIMPFLLHHGCASFMYKDLFMSEIKKGNMHPQDLAYINDFYKSQNSFLPYYCSNIKFKGIYTSSPKTGLLTGENEIENANKLRKELYMTSYEVFLKKREFALKNKFVLNFGFLYSARL